MFVSEYHPSYPGLSTLGLEGKDNKIRTSWVESNIHSACTILVSILIQEFQVIIDNLRYKTL